MRRFLTLAWKAVTGAAQREREHQERLAAIDAQIAATRIMLDAARVVLEEAQRDLKDVRCFVNEFIVPTDTEVGQ